MYGNFYVYLLISKNIFLTIDVKISLYKPGNLMINKQLNGHE